MSTSEKNIRVTCQGAQTLPLDRIEEFQGNLKRLSKKNLEKLKKRIIEDGFNVPFFVWDHEGMYKALDGHQRIKALCSLREEGWDIPLLPVAFIEASDEADARKKLLAISSQYGEFDSAELGEWLDEIGGDVAEMLRLVDTDIPIEVASEEKEVKDAEPQVDKAEELNKKWQVKQGDVWQLGEHRLMCGDSTSIDDVEKLMDGQKADMVFTDPPYGVDYDGGHATEKRREKLANDDDVDMYDLPIKNAYLASTDKAPIYLWFADRFAIDVLNGLAGAGYQVRNWIVWNKNLAQFGAIGAQYKSKHEPCIYAFKKGKSPNWFGPNNEVTVWDVKREPKNAFHPTQKPVTLAIRAVCNSSQPENIVLDLFSGSGSTLIACENTERVCYGMELDPKYCAVILQRYFDVTGNNPKKVV